MTLSTRAREQTTTRKPRSRATQALVISRSAICVRRRLSQAKPGTQSHQKHKPRWMMGGAVEAIAHRKCNRRWNNIHDTPKFHKNNRLRSKHIGAHRSSQPMRFGRDDSIKLRMNAPPVYRDSGKPVLSRPWVKTL